jgi:hypothetical protein
MWRHDLLGKSCRQPAVQLLAEQAKKEKSKMKVDYTYRRLLRRRKQK